MKISKELAKGSTGLLVLASYQRPICTATR